MHRTKNEGRRLKRGAQRALVLYLPLLVTLILLSPFQGAMAAAQVESGMTQTLGNSTNQGTTSYVVYYTYPSTAPVGSNLTISLSLHVGSFSGVIEFIVGYEMQVALYVGEQEQQVTLAGPAGFNASSFLYPGGIWGPVNATFPLTENNTGLALGESANATFSVTLLDSIYVGAPYLHIETEDPMQGQGGTVLIENGVTSTTSSTSIGSTTGNGGQTLLPYALLASGAVLIAGAIIVPRGPRPPAPNAK
ncbi:MAG: hypothetical protein ACRD6W_05385 [Nitrososphaerales archaeon]